MTFLYPLIIKLYFALVWLASFFNAKAKLFINGRKHVFRDLKIMLPANEKRIWLHFASLGEFEQGRSVLEGLKKTSNKIEIVVTFFSPSGYEIRKNYPGVKVFYLPMDSKKNAEKFIQIVNPYLAIFTKYEFWHFYFDEMKRKEIPLLLISSIFRENQVFFNWYGGFYRKMLSAVTHFFVQNKESLNLLQKINITNATLTGDTRFDRVFENASKPKKLPIIEAFLKNHQTLVAGSTWPKDELLLSALVEKYLDWKFVLAPHEVDKSHIDDLTRLFKPHCILYSELSKNENIKEISLAQILIIDNIGMLSSLYQFGELAYIGGGFGAGIHNTLEAAAFGLPVIFGPKYQKFQEAKDLITIGAGKSISNEDELIAAFKLFKGNKKASAEAKKYVADKKGATEIILKFINRMLKN